MPALKTYDLFISHAWKYGDDYDRLVRLLDDASNFYYRNYSAPEHKPLELDDGSTESEIQEAITRKIRPVNCVLIIAGMYYNHREWMQFELERSYELSKPIVAIRPWGNEIMPTEVTEKDDTVVGWNTNSIVSAIRQYSL